MKRPKRRVPWFIPQPILQRRRRAARFKRKHGTPTIDQQNAAIAAAGYQPLPDTQPPAIHRELRKTLGEVEHEQG